jgi:hypothetical protein
MDASTARQVLERNDDPVAVERPAHQNLRDEMGRASALANDLVKTFGVAQAEIGPPLIQDASFLAHFLVPPEATRRGHGIWVRISNFGGLASAGAVLPDAYGDGEIPSLIDDDEWRTVLVALERHGYVYVPQDFLLTDYDGVNAPLIACYGESGSSLTWWTRFFDWI